MKNRFVLVWMCIMLMSSSLVPALFVPRVFSGSFPPYGQPPSLVTANLDDPTDAYTQHPNASFPYAAWTSGMSFYAYIDIINVTWIMGYQVGFTFDPTHLQVTNVTDGGFLTSVGGSVETSTGFGNNGLESVRNASGLVTPVSEMLSNSGPFPTGSGHLVKIGFKIASYSPPHIPPFSGGPASMIGGIATFLDVFGGPGPLIITPPESQVRSGFLLIPPDEPPATEWNKTFNCVGPDFAYKAIQTSDGGYALAGITYLSSLNGTAAQPWLVKTDSLGDALWNWTFRAANHEVAYCAVQTSDGGYALAGTAYITDSNSFDMLLIKIDSSGNFMWNRTYGGIYDDGARSLVQTSDGGYALAGWTYSYEAGNYDFWLVKTDSEGYATWNKTYGGIGDDQAYSIVQTSDGGYALAGEKQISTGFPLDDFWLIKTDSSGNAQFNRTYGGVNNDIAYSVIQTSLGGYALAGSTQSFGTGLENAWLVLTDQLGNLIVNRTYGQTLYNYAYSVIQTRDGGYALGGKTEASGDGNYDSWLIKTLPMGNILWSRTYGGTSDDEADSVIQTSDGGYALAGYTTSYGNGDGDFWLVKIASDLHDLAVVSVQPTQRFVLPGAIVNITVQVENQGAYPESSNVNLYVGPTVLETHGTGLIDPGELATFVFAWDTTSFAPDSYILRAYALEVWYEAPPELNDNNLVNGTVIIGAETPTGTSVTVSPSPNTQVTFTEITTAGITSLNMTQPPSNTLTAAPNSVFVEITTTATYADNVVLQFAYDPAGLSLEDERAMRIWLWNQASSLWVDITTSVDTVNNIVYGVSPHLSMFGVTCSLGLTDNNGYQIPTTVGTPSSPPSLPDYLEALAYFDIQATTQYASPVTVRLAYDPSTISPEQALFLQMWVWNGAVWIDVTTRIDTISHVVCGVSPHLSMFGVTTFNPQIVTGATPIAGIAGINGYKLLFKETVGNPFSSPASIDYSWSFSVEKWSGTQWVATAISGSSPLLTGYFIPAQTTVDLPYYGFCLPLTGPNAVAWGDWLRISYVFHWAYSGISYSTNYVAKLHVHPPDIAGAANAAPYYGSDGSVGPPDLGIISPNWKKTAPPSIDPTSNLAKADINGDGSVGPADLGILSAKWKQTWTNTPPP